MSHQTSTKNNFLISSLAPGIACLFTNPLEVAKVRKQMDGELKGKTSGVYKGTFQTLYSIGKFEGLKGLQAGLPIAVIRESSKNFFRIGAFQPILKLLHGKDRKDLAPVHLQLIAGMMSGSIGAFVCNPIEVIKTRLQAETSLALSVGRKQFGYTGLGDAFYRLVTEEGVKGMWGGVTVSMVRSSAFTSVHMTSYTSFKHMALNDYHYYDGPPIHIVCSVFSAFLAVIACNPFDVVRNRIYNQVGGKTLYNGAVDCIFKIIKTEGPQAFYKGFWQHFLRSGPHFVLTFTILEQLRKVLS